MRVKTSITLPKELLGRLDQVDKNRSALAARAYLAQFEGQARDRKDIEIIDRIAERLNREAMDTLEYQRPRCRAESFARCVSRVRKTDAACS